MSETPEVGDRYHKDRGMINEYEVVRVDEVFDSYSVVLESVEENPMTGEKATFNVSRKQLAHEYERV